MANRSNKDLVTDIVAVSAKLGKTVDTNGLGNPELVTLLESLQGELPAAGPETPKLGGTDQERLQKEAEERAREAAEANRLREEAAKAAASGTAEYRVAPGQAIVCLRGHVDENQPISAADFKDKDVALKDLLERGAIVRSK
jgi:hypothetical protein